MNYLFISPNFPSNMAHFVNRLRQHGVRVLGLGDVDFSQLSPSLQEDLTYYYRVDNLHDYDTIVRAVGFFIYHFGRMDRIESHNDYWMSLDASLRSDFNVFGLKKEDLPIFRKKSMMKDIFRKARIGHNPGLVINNKEELEKGISHFGLPVIVKPDDGVGGQATFKLEKEEDLQAVLPYLGQHQYFMESFIDGDMVTYDGLVDSQGKIVYESSLTYQRPMLDYVGANTTVVFYRFKTMDPKLAQTGRRAIKKFNFQERFFHLEFFKAKNRLIALELNCRIPGGPIVDMMNFADEIDLYDQYARIVSGEGFQGPIRHHYHVAYVGRRYANPYRYSFQQIQTKAREALVLAGPVDGVLREAMGDEMMVFRHKNKEKLMDLVQMASAIKE